MQGIPAYSISARPHSPSDRYKDGSVLILDSIYIFLSDLNPTGDVATYK